MKTYWGSGGIAPRILDLSTRWRWVVSFTPRPLYPRGREPGTHWIGGWVGPRAVLDAAVKRKIPSATKFRQTATCVERSWILALRTYSPPWQCSSSQASSFGPNSQLLKWNTDPIPLIRPRMISGCFQK
jgi:hypothetical protein